MNIGSTVISPRYVIVSPVKDEDCYVELTLLSVTCQTLKPVLWVVVDDGSRDETPKIVSRYTVEHPFIQLVRNPDAGARKPGSAVIRAFKYGCESIRDTQYDFIVKLDCDLSFQPDYFEQLLRRFVSDEGLGIASGVYLETDRMGEWKEIVMPPYHAAGACKMLRRRCFEGIGGFVGTAGWDTVDEIRAMTQGWTTTHFRDIQMKHHKREGSSIGTIKTSVMQGEAYYRSGGSKLFFLLKVLHRVTSMPYLVGAIGLGWGYLRAMLGRKSLLVTEAEARYYKELLLGRLTSRVKSVFKTGRNL